MYYKIAERIGIRLIVESSFYKHLFWGNSPHGDSIELGMLDNHDVHLACILVLLLLLEI